MALTKVRGSGLDGATALKGQELVIDADGDTSIDASSADDTIVVDTAGSERMRIDSSGNVGIGTTSPSQKVHIEGSGNQFILLNNTSTNDGLYFKAGTGESAIQTNAGSNKLTFYTGGNERMNITSVGYLNVPGVYANTTSNSANVACHYSSGDITRSTSSRRYKNTIKDTDVGLAELNKLRTVSFKGNNDGDIIFNGLIAEEVHDVGLTQFVEYDDENRPDGLRYPHMISLCIKAIQELSAKVETLEAKVTALESK